MLSNNQARPSELLVFLFFFNELRAFALVFKHGFLAILVNNSDNRDGRSLVLQVLPDIDARALSNTGSRLPPSRTSQVR